MLKALTAELTGMAETGSRERPMSTIYRSRVDRWLAILVGSGALVASCASVQLAFSETPGQWWIIAPLIGFGVVLPAWVFRTTEYRLSDDVLAIRSGPFHWWVAVPSITSVRPTRNPLSSPALSLDRLEIKYGNGRWVMISPQDAEGFLADLRSRPTIPAGSPLRATANVMA
jgi:hypothetical protein